MMHSDPPWTGGLRSPSSCIYICTWQEEFSLAVVACAAYTHKSNEQEITISWMRDSVVDYHQVSNQEIGHENNFCMIVYEPRSRILPDVGSKHRPSTSEGFQTNSDLEGRVFSGCDNNYNSIGDHFLHDIREY